MRIENVITVCSTVALHRQTRILGGSSRLVYFKWWSATVWKFSRCREDTAASPSSTEKPRNSPRHEYSNTEIELRVSLKNSYRSSLIRPSSSLDRGFKCSGTFVSINYSALYKEGIGQIRERIHLRGKAFEGRINRSFSIVFEWYIIYEGYTMIRFEQNIYSGKIKLIYIYVVNNNNFRSKRSLLFL